MPKHKERADCKQKQIKSLASNFEIMEPPKYRSKQNLHRNLLETSLLRAKRGRLQKSSRPWLASRPKRYRSRKVDLG